MYIKKIGSRTAADFFGRYDILFPQRCRIYAIFYFFIY